MLENSEETVQTQASGIVNHILLELFCLHFISY